MPTTLPTVQQILLDYNSAIGAPGTNTYADPTNGNQKTMDIDAVGFMQNAGWMMNNAAQFRTLNIF